MGKPQLAVIIPYAGEYPHLHYTLQSLQMELEGHVDDEVVLVNNNRDYEVILVNNNTVPAVGNPTLTGLNKLIEGQASDWLRQLTYRDKLSHWACKNLAVRYTEAPFLFFLDAHCLIHPGTLREMFGYYRLNWQMLTGSLHLPISDFLKMNWPKWYRLVYDAEIGLLHYENERMPVELMGPEFILRVQGKLSNASKAELGELIAKWRDPDEYNQAYPPLSQHIPRPCMSTCGMICRREHIVDDLDFWPNELGPYGGGENYYNFVMARLGRKKWVYPTQPLRHWHIPGVWSRDYRISYKDWARNIMIATFLVAGPEWLDRLSMRDERLPKWHPVRQLNPSDVAGLRQEILSSESLGLRRERLEAKFIMSIKEWAEQWQ